jgi:hypothetical protein
MEELDELAWMASFADSLFSGMLHVLKLTSLHPIYGRPVKSLLYRLAC